MLFPKMPKMYWEGNVKQIKLNFEKVEKTKYSIKLR